MRPMDRYLARIKLARTDAGIELIIQEIYELGFDKGRCLRRGGSDRNGNG